MQRYFSDLKKDNCLVLKKEDLYHIKTVMRMKEDLIEVVYQNKLNICKLDKDYNALIVEVKDDINNKKIRYTLCIPLLQEQKMSFVLQKATELGVDEIIPVLTTRSIVKINDKEDKKIERWNKICKEASEQSKRLDIPVIKKITKIEDLSLGDLSGKSEEISAGINRGEYLPINAYEKRFYIATREQKMYALSGKAIIEEEKKEGLKYSAKVQTVNEKTEFELPYIYYPGYTIKSDGMNLEKHETENGFLGFCMEANDSGKIEVSYEGTKIEKFANFISIISTLVIIGYAFASSKSNIKA